MNDDTLPARETLLEAGNLLKPANLPHGMDISEVARLAAFDAAYLMYRIQKAIWGALEKIETLEDAGLDREIALGAGLDLASKEGKETVYREAIFEACCKHLDLTCEEGNRCLKRYWQVESTIQT